MDFSWNTLIDWLLMQLQSLAGLFVVLLVSVGLLYWLNKSTQEHDDRRYQKQLIGVLLGFCSLVAIVASLPVDESLRNQLLTLIGLVVTAILTLSSTNIAGNALAGLMLRSLGHFRPGDFVLVQDYFGRVTEQNLFHTEIQTEDRDLLALPNMFMAANPVKVIHATGTVVTASVSLGYDVHRQQAQSLLKIAGEEAGLTDVFVLITDLGDFAVHYRVYGFLSEVKTLISARSNLRCSMLDCLHSAGVEIVSPNFMNQRQVPEPVFPVDHHPPQSEEEQALSPEQTLFDKAERAQQLEDLKDNLRDIIDEIKGLEESLKDQDEATAAETKQQIERRKRRQKAVERALQYFQAQLIK